MNDKEQQRRFEAIRRLLPFAIANLREYAQRPSDGRTFIEKADRSKVTQPELDNDERAESYVRTHFPNDSVITEERPPVIFPGTRFCFLQDPGDGTYAMIEYGLKYNIPTVLQAYTDCGKAFAFGVGEVATGNLFTGNVDDGLFLYAHPYAIPERGERFLLWIDHHEHPDVLLEMCGFRALGPAGVAIRLLLYGYLKGGINVYTHHLYESACFDAVVRTMRGTITAIDAPTGGQWHVFSMPDTDHASVVRKAHRSIEESQ